MKIYSPFDIIYIIFQSTLDSIYLFYLLFKFKFNTIDIQIFLENKLKEIKNKKLEKIKQLSNEIFKNKSKLDK